MIAPSRTVGSWLWGCVSDLDITERLVVEEVLLVRADSREAMSVSRLRDEMLALGTGETPAADVAGDGEVMAKKS